MGEKIQDTNGLVEIWEHKGFKFWAITMYTPLYGWTNPRQQRGGGVTCLIRGDLKNMGQS